MTVSFFPPVVPDVIAAWQCIGCGRVEAPQPCVGVCQDQKVEFVYASAYRYALDRLRAAEERSAALEALVLRLAHTSPRAGEAHRCFAAFQAEAGKLVANGRQASRFSGAPGPAISQN